MLAARELAGRQPNLTASGLAHLLEISPEIAAAAHASPFAADDTSPQHALAVELLGQKREARGAQSRLLQDIPELNARITALDAAIDAELAGCTATTRTS